MAVFLNRPVGDLLVRSRRALGMTQRQFGEALGASQRTAERWDAGRSQPGLDEFKTLARLVFPLDRALAAEIAAACSETLVSMGLVAPPAPVQAPSIPRSVLIDSIVSAAADATEVRPASARAGLIAAFTRATELGVPLSELAQTLTPTKPS